MRLFTAIELPEPVRQHLLGLITHLEAAWVSAGYADQIERSWLRYTRPENLHVTLKFLGEVEETRVPDVCRVLAEVESGPANPLVVDRPELLPPRRGPVRIVAVGLGGDVGAVNRLYRSVDDRCADLGFARERRDYRAHITLARARTVVPKEFRDRFAEELNRRLPGPNFAADTFVLMESHLKPTGPEYRRVAAFPLTGGATGPVVS